MKLALLGAVFLAIHCTRQSEYTTALDLNRKVNYIDDIQPILEEKCLKCHGNPPRDGAPQGSQYTSFNDAVGFGEDILTRIIDGTMPPPEKIKPLTREEIKIFQAWIETGYFLSVDDTVGGIQPFSMKFISLQSPLTSGESTLRLELAFTGYTAFDKLSLYYNSNNSGHNGILIADSLPVTSRVSVDWEIGILPKNSSYYVYGVVSHQDGSTESLYSAFPLSIPDRNTIPSIQIFSPQPDTVISESQLEVRWSQTDLEGSAMTTTISYRPDSTGDFTELVSNQSFSKGNFLWDLSSAVTGSQYNLKIQVTDAEGAVNEKITGPFSVINGSLPTYIGNIKSIIDFYCNDCHSRPPDHDAPDSFALETYDEVVAFAERIRVRSVEERSMPPEEEAPMSQADVQTVLFWIQSGMPMGEENLPPSLEFLNLLAEAVSVEDRFTLRWQADDFDNNAIINLYYYFEDAPEDTLLLASELREEQDSMYVFLTDKLPSQSRLKIIASISDGVNPVLWVEAPGTLILENRNAAPKVKITSPMAYDALTDSLATISWLATDPENANLKISLYYKTDSLAELTQLASGQEFSTPNFSWDLSQLNTGAAYALFIKVEDPDGLFDWDSVFNIAVINGNIPTYYGTVKSIIEFKCNNCHGVPPQEDAPDTFNLLTYDDVVAMQKNIIVRTVEERTMPPADAEDLTPEEREQLTIWLQSGMPLGAANIPPTFAFLAPTGSAMPTQDRFTILWDAQDIDNNAYIDLFWISTLNPQDTVLIISDLREDVDSSYVFNTSTVPGNTDIQILASIYDGVNEKVWVGSKGIITTEDRNTVPSLVITNPAGGEIFIEDVLNVTFSGTDRDGDSLNFALFYSLDSLSFTPIAEIANASTYDWDISALPFGLSYYLRIIVTDSPGGASDTSDTPRFGIAHLPAEIPTFWASVKPIFDAKCNQCHASPFSENAPETFDLSLYTKFGALNGAIEKKSQIETQLLQDLMPPKGEPDLTAFETEQIIYWLLGGIPEGQEGVSAIPTLAFTIPSAQGETVENDLATIAWNAADPDNDAQINLYYDSDNTGYNGTPITAGLSENTMTEYVWNTNTIPGDNTYFIYGSISDGINDTVWVYAPGSFYVAPRLNSPPVVSIISPQPGESFTSGSVPITWSASDLDGDPLTMEIFYTPGDGFWTALDTVNNTGSYDWATDGLDNGTAYQIRVRADDGRGLAGEDTSGVITIHSGTTTYQYNDSYIKPFFDTYCVTCHSGRSAPKRLSLDTYPSITSKPGTLDKIITEVNTLETMPPRDEPQPSAEERARILDWILGGAPQ